MNSFLLSAASPSLSLDPSRKRERWSSCRVEQTLGIEIAQRPKQRFDRMQPGINRKYAEDATTVKLPLAELSME